MTTSTPHAAVLYCSKTTRKWTTNPGDDSIMFVLCNPKNTHPLMFPSPTLPSALNPSLSFKPLPFVKGQLLNSPNLNNYTWSVLRDFVFMIVWKDEFTNGEWVEEEIPEKKNTTSPKKRPSKLETPPKMETSIKRTTTPNANTEKHAPRASLKKSETTKIPGNSGNSGNTGPTGTPLKSLPGTSSPMGSSLKSLQAIPQKSLTPTKPEQAASPSSLRSPSRHTLPPGKGVPLDLNIEELGLSTKSIEFLGEPDFDETVNSSLLRNNFSGSVVTLSDADYDALEDLDKEFGALQDLVSGYDDPTVNSDPSIFSLLGIASFFGLKNDFEDEQQIPKRSPPRPTSKLTPSVHSTESPLTSRGSQSIQQQQQTPPPPPPQQQQQQQQQQHSPSSLGSPRAQSRQYRQRSVGNSSQEVFRLPPVLWEYDGLKLEREDWEQLLGKTNGGALGTKVVDLYMVLKNKLKKNISIHHAPSSFYDDIVKDYTTLLGYVEQYDLLSFEKILFPVKVAEHWSLVLVNMKEQHLEYYDPADADGDAVLKTFKKFFKEIQKYAKKSKSRKTASHKPPSLKKIVQHNIPHNPKDADSGIFVLLYVQALSDFKEIPWLTYPRKVIAVEMLTNLDLIQNLELVIKSNLNHQVESASTTEILTAPTSPVSPILTPSTKSRPSNLALSLDHLSEKKPKKEKSARDKKLLKSSRTPPEEKSGNLSARLPFNTKEEEKRKKGSMSSRSPPSPFEEAATEKKKDLLEKIKKGNVSVRNLEEPEKGVPVTPGTGTKKGNPSVRNFEEPEKGVPVTPGTGTKKGNPSVRNFEEPEKGVPVTPGTFPKKGNPSARPPAALAAMAAVAAAAASAATEKGEVRGPGGGGAAEEGTSRKVPLSSRSATVGRSALQRDKRNTIVPERVAVTEVVIDGDDTKKRRLSK